MPVDGAHSLLGQQTIGLGEVAATDKTAMSRERAGVRRTQHMVSAPVNEASLLLGMGPPQQKDHSLTAGIDLLDNPVCEGPPTQWGVGGGHPRVYR